MFYRKPLSLVYLLLVAVASMPIAACKDSGGTSDDTKLNKTNTTDLEKLTPSLQELVKLDLKPTNTAIDTVRATNTTTGNAVALHACLEYLKRNDSTSTERAKNFGEAGGGAADTYCAMLSQVQRFFVELGPLLEFIVSQVNDNSNAPAYRPLAANLRPTVLGLVNKPTASMEYILSKAKTLITAAKPELIVDKLPINLELSILNFEFENDTPEDVSFDLAGRWDRSDLHALATAAGVIAGLFNFVAAHNLTIDLSVLLDDVRSTAEIAQMLVTEPNMLSFDDPALAKKGIDQFVEALDFLVGTAGGGLGQAGVVASIEQEMADGLDHSKDVIRFIDVNNNKLFDIGDHLFFKPIESASASIADIDPEDAEVEFDFSRTGLLKLVELFQDLRSNIKTETPKIIKLASYVYNSEETDYNTRADNYLWQELQYHGNAAKDFVFQDWFGFDLKPFVDDPIAVRNFMPAVIQNSANAPTAYDFAIECELDYSTAEFLNPAVEDATVGFATNSTWRRLCAAQAEGTTSYLKRISFNDSPGAVTGDFAFGNGPDYAHFVSAVVEEATTAAELLNPTLGPIIFAESMKPLTQVNLPLEADGIRPSASGGGLENPNDGGFYVILQDPNFGALYLDLGGSGNEFTMKLATHETLNQMLNRAIGEAVGAIGESIE